MGDARRRLLATGKKFRPKPEPPMRSPEEVEAEHHSAMRAHAYIAAAIDFLNEVGEHAERQQTERVLRVNSKP